MQKTVGNIRCVPHRQLFFIECAAIRAAEIPEIKNRLERLFKAIWQRMKDSNPHERSQSPVCYLYTNPLQARDIIHLSDKKSIVFLNFFKILFYPVFTTKK